MPCFVNDECELSYNQESGLINTKPHGNGDINMLLSQPSIVEKLKSKNCKWIYFMNDTNPLAITNLPSVMGYTVSQNLKVALTGIPRQKGETTGLILETKDSQCRLIDYHEWNLMIKRLRQSKPNDSSWKQKLESLEKESVASINNLLIDFDVYLNQVAKCKNLEFVNVKRCPNTKNILSSFRLETWYLDVLKDLEESIGFPVFPREICFTTCKNKISTGAQKQENGLPSETIISCENDLMFKNHLMIQKIQGNETSEDVQEKVMNSIKIRDIPSLILDSSCGLFFSDLAEKLKDEIFNQGKKSFYCFLGF